VISVIHEDRLVGNRQFWVTRPYSWRGLLLAKALFVLMFVNLPIFLSQIAALAENGLSPLHYLPQLLWRQISLTAGLFLTIAVLAALTANLVQVMLVLIAGYAALAVGVILLARTFTVSAGSLSMGCAAPIDNAVLLAIQVFFSVSVCVLQYSRRAPLAARCLFVCGISTSLGFVHVVPWGSEFALAARSLPAVDPAAVRLAPDYPRDVIDSGPTYFDRGMQPLFLPIQVTGIPDGMAVYSERVLLTVETAGGERWSSGWSNSSQVRDKTLAMEPAERLLPGAGAPYMLQANVDGSFFDNFSTEHVHLHAKVAFTMLGPAHVTQLAPEGRPTAAPDGSFCSYSKRQAYVSVSCFSPLKPATMRVVRIQPLPTGKPQDVGSVEGQPGSQSASLFSVWEMLGGGAGISTPQEPFVATFETRQAVAHFERELDMPNIQLGNFRAR
jgi:hypothetical protein